MTTTTTEASPNLVALDWDECWDLLATETVGRVAVAAIDHFPLVVPVNYVLDAKVIVFRSDPGAKLALLRQGRASFQVDFTDPSRHTGWSVLVKGIAYEALPADVAHLELMPWVGERECWIRFVPISITGRRIELPEYIREQRAYL